VDDVFDVDCLQELVEAVEIGIFKRSAQIHKIDGGGHRFTFFYEYGALV
jgi:hypothetical protein